MDIYTILFLIAVILFIITEFLTHKQCTQNTKDDKKWNKWKIKF